MIFSVTDIKMQRGGWMVITIALRSYFVWMGLFCRMKWIIYTEFPIGVTVKSEWLFDWGSVQGPTQAYINSNLVHSFM